MRDHHVITFPKNNRGKVQKTSLRKVCCHSRSSLPLDDQGTAARHEWWWVWSHCWDRQTPPCCVGNLRHRYALASYCLGTWCTGEPGELGWAGGGSSLHCQGVSCMRRVAGDSGGLPCTLHCGTRRERLGSHSLHRCMAACRSCWRSRWRASRDVACPPRHRSLTRRQLDQNSLRWAGQWRAGWPGRWRCKRSWNPSSIYHSRCWSPRPSLLSGSRQPHRTSLKK